MGQETGSGSPVVDAPRVGLIGRLVGVLFSPVRTFEAIAARPGWDWFVPVLLIAAAGMFAQTVAMNRVDTDEAVREQMRFVEKMAGANLSEADKDKLEEQTREQFEAQKNPVRRALFIPLVFIPTLFVPAVYRAVVAVAGATGTYKKILAGYAWVQVPQVIYLLLSGLVTLPRSDVGVADAQYMRLLKSNPAAFLSWDDTHKSLLALLSSVDLFDIWALVLGAIALSKMTSFKRSTAYGVVGGVWGVYILVKVVLGAVFQGFAG